MGGGGGGGLVCDDLYLMFVGGDEETTSRRDGTSSGKGTAPLFGKYSVHWRSVQVEGKVYNVGITRKVYMYMCVRLLCNYRGCEGNTMHSCTNFCHN